MGLVTKLTIKTPEWLERMPYEPEVDKINRRKKQKSR
jgi:hypothetical protein